MKKKRKLSLSQDEDDDLETQQVVNRPHSVTVHILRNVQTIQTNLLDWFSGVRHARGMPWRQPMDDTSSETRAHRAYQVWVSEIMLQQTQVATVIPYYTRWMEKFPTIHDLAAADIDTVNGLWKGLGYYSRAARLLKGAQKVVVEYDGCLPADAKTLEKEIPGIGRYSAGAICSIAYGICAPVLDGNVHRLLSRVLALHAPPKAKKTLDLLWGSAETMVEGSDRPGDINQALIELGSTVCRARDPKCESCPIKNGCGAYKEFKGNISSARDIEDLCDVCEPGPSGNSVTRYPMRVVKKKARTEIDAVYVIGWEYKDERYFALVRRPEGGLLAGLYEFPSCENIDENETELLEPPHSVLGDLLVSPPPNYKPLCGNHAVTGGIQGGLRIAEIRHIGDTVHAFTHIRKTYRIVSVVLQGGTSPPQLRNSLSSEAQHQAKKGKTHDIKAANTGAPARWVLETEVADANIGTGVLNVWKKARSFWNSSMR
ncbi:DNA glycosylase [Ramaria rubella]|nr:DNA glycosylase [Ramaria rubella]